MRTVQSNDQHVDRNADAPIVFRLADNASITLDEARLVIESEFKRSAGTLLFSLATDAPSTSETWELFYALKESAARLGGGLGHERLDDVLSDIEHAVIALMGDPSWDDAE